MTKSSLEQRIASALSPTDDIASSDLATLIVEVEAAAEEADATATRTREEALDPTIVIDAAKVGAGVATAELTRDRLQAALPRIQERHKQVRQAEAVAAWTAEAEEMEARRIAKMTEFADFYPEMYERIVDHLYSMRALDREIDDLNRRRPDWSVAGLPYSTPAFTMELKIPDPYKNGKLLWPPPQPNLALQYLAIMPPDPFIISEAAKGTYIDNRNRQIVEDNQRVAEAAQRQREREEREAAEARKAQEAERAAYYAEHGWPR